MKEFVKKIRWSNVALSVLLFAIPLAVGFLLDDWIAAGFAAAAVVCLILVDFYRFDARRWERIAHKIDSDFYEATGHLAKHELQIAVMKAQGVDVPDYEDCIKYAVTQSLSGVMGSSLPDNVEIVTLTEEDMRRMTEDEKDNG